MSIYNILKRTGLPVAYSHFEKAQELPFIVYLGNGQNVCLADNEVFYKQNTYQIEYYFKEKNEAIEDSIESLLSSNGFIYTKSEDSFIESDEVFVIYYNV